jgi:hypothetical protein
MNDNKNITMNNHIDNNKIYDGNNNSNDNNDGVKYDNVDNTDNDDNICISN